MATYYVSSVDGSDADNGSTWALAKATIAGALAVATADGDIIYVDSAHNFTNSGASIAYDAATANTSIAIISVNRNGSTTTGHSGWLAGASETIGTSGFGMSIAATRTQRLFIFGVAFIGNAGASSNNNLAIANGSGGVYATVEMVSCTLNLPGAINTTLLLFGANANSNGAVSKVKLKDCSLVIRNSTGSNPALAMRGVVLEIFNPTFSFAGASKPTNLIGGGASFGWSEVIISDADLTGYNAAGSYVSAGSIVGAIVFRNCKLSAAPSQVTGSFRDNAASVTFVNCDSADTKTKLAYYNRLGTLLSTEGIYRNGGFDVGGTNVSWQIVTTSACNEAEPFVTPWMTPGFVSNIVSTTASAKIIHDSATNLHNRNIEMEVEYVSDASFPLGTLASTRNAQPFDGTSADYAADTDTWTGTGGFTNPNKQKIEKTFTPAEGSAIHARLLVRAASKTLYVEPKLLIT